MGLLTLGAAQGTTIAVTAKGEDAERCLDAIAALVGGTLRRGRIDGRPRPADQEHKDIFICDCVSGEPC
jgi:hypothetical protein